MEKKNIQAKDTQGSEKYFSQLLENAKFLAIILDDRSKSHFAAIFFVQSASNPGPSPVPSFTGSSTAHIAWNY
jgi:hypothetical protein